MDLWVHRCLAGQMYSLIPRPCAFVTCSTKFTQISYRKQQMRRTWERSQQIYQLYALLSLTTTLTYLLIWLTEGDPPSISLHCSHLHLGAVAGHHNMCWNTTPPGSQCSSLRVVPTAVSHHYWLWISVTDQRADLLDGIGGSTNLLDSLGDCHNNNNYCTK